jgi:hypothetical protein
MKKQNDCQNRREAIASLILGELDSQAADKLKKHIDACQTCQHLYKMLAKEEGMIQAAFKSVKDRTDNIQKKLIEQFDKQKLQPLSRGRAILRRPTGGSKIMKQITKFAAAAVIIIAVLAAIHHFGGSIDGTSVAWADVLEQISEVRPYACRMTFDFDGDRPDISYKVMYKNLSIRREERDDGSIFIFDMSKKPVKTLALYPDKKLAREEVLLDRGPLKDPDMLRMIANRQNGTEEDLGLSEINGITVKIFHSPNEHNEFTVWADVETNLPVRVELRQSSSGRTIIMEDFEFVVEFDESLFDTTAPEDYAVQRVKMPGGQETIIKTEGIAKDVGFEFYVLSVAPAWANKPRTLKTPNVMGLGDDIYMTCSLAEDGRHVVFMQSKMMSEMLLNKIRTGEHVYTSASGLKVYRGGPEKWYSGILLEAVGSMLPDKPSADRIGCGIETPDEGVILLSINGPATDEELHNLIDSLMLAKE